MERLARGIDSLNESIGRAVAWLTLVMVVLQFALVMLRYVFGLSASAWEELLLYFHGSLFLLAAAYTLKHDGHVRVDLLYRDASAEAKARINFYGTILLLVPLCALIAWVGWPFVLAAWQSLEGSTETSGLPFKYIYKTAILVFALLIFVQGLAQAIKAWLVLSGRTVEQEHDGAVL